MTSNYRQLDATKIINTIERLKARIDERFPGSGLHGVATDLLETAIYTQDRAVALGRPILWVRLLVGFFLVCVALLLFIACRLGNVCRIWTSSDGGFCLMDPHLVLSQEPATPASPKRTLSPFKLERYLDYCSEMLSLTGKVVALYAQDFPDAVVIQAVNDIEMLATNLSRKIWQKIAILQVAIQNPNNRKAAT